MKSNYTKFLVLLFWFSCIKLLGQEKEESLFSFEPDIRVFTLHAFMNIAGFDHEWRKTGMDSLRIEIRDTLNSVLPPDLIERMKSYRSETNNHGWAGWAIYGLASNGYPDYDLNYEKSTSEVYNIGIEYKGLSPLLKDFFDKGNIEGLWSHYKPLLKSRNERYQPFAMIALNNIIKYCKLNNDYFDQVASKIHFQESPLMSHFTAQTVKVNGEIWLVNSPSESKPGPSRFYHETLHHVIDPIVEQLHPDVIQRLEPLNELIKDKETAYEIIIESIVRTFDMVLRNASPDRTEEMINNEYALGFLLCPFIYESIRDFELSEISTSDFIEQTLISLDIQTETKRWEEFNSN